MIHPEKDSLAPDRYAAETRDDVLDSGTLEEIVVPVVVRYGLVVEVVGLVLLLEWGSVNSCSMAERYVRGRWRRGVDREYWER